MSVEGIRRALVVGAGTMRQQSELQCAMHGHAVTVHDVAAQCPQAARARIRIDAERLVNGKRLAHGETDANQSRIGFTTNPAEAVKADLLSESVPEDSDLNARVSAQFHKLCLPYTIFTTDTPRSGSVPPGRRRPAGLRSSPPSTSTPVFGIRGRCFKRSCLPSQACQPGYARRSLLEANI